MALVGDGGVSRCAVERLDGVACVALAAALADPLDEGHADEAVLAGLVLVEELLDGPAVGGHENERGADGR